MKLTGERSMFRFLNVVKDLPEADVANMKRDGVNFDGLLGVSDSAPDIEEYVKAAFDTTTPISRERFEVLKAVAGMEIKPMWDILNHRVPTADVVGSIRNVMWGSPYYDFPQFTRLHWDSYAYRIGLLPMSRLQHLSDVLERRAPVTYRANDSIDMLNVPMPEEQLGALRTFADVWVGLPNPVDDAVWNLMRAFRGIHIYDAWFISRYAIHSLTFAQSEVTTNDAARRASAIVRALRKEMGVTPCVPTLISDITGEVSERLYACINKASTLEELIEYPSATVVFRSQSAALLEELLSVYQEHGYPHAYIGWLHGVGPRIFV